MREAAPPAALLTQKRDPQKASMAAAGASSRPTPGTRLREKPAPSLLGGPGAGRTGAVLPVPPSPPAAGGAGATAPLLSAPQAGRRRPGPRRRGEASWGG